MAVAWAEKQQRSHSRGGARDTSVGGGKVRTGHRVHGTKASDEDGAGPSRGRDRTSRPRVRREYDTPFDDKGRCHHHKNVQLAAKKMTGGWKVLSRACPRCMEEKHDDGGDEKSVRSVRSANGSSAAAAVGGDEPGEKYDANGCCVLHSHVQIAKKKLFGGGWKPLRVCPSCGGGAAIGLDDDAISVKSGRSARSVSRPRSKSLKSKKSSDGGKSSEKKDKSRGRPGAATGSGRYGALPFDGDGYCCVHPSVQIAQKRMLTGGFRIVHDVCPECAREEEGRGGKGVPRRTRSSSRGRRGSSRRRRADDGDADEGPQDASSVVKRRIRVKNLRTEDADGFRGRYSGYVDDDHRPHGIGVMKYENGSEWEGVWSEGSQVRQLRQRQPNDGVGDESPRDGASSAMKKRIRVKNLKTEDENGVHGRYSGYVNDGHQPHGNGVMKYEDGNEWEGVWSDGSQVHGKMTMGGQAMGGQEV